MKSHHERAHPSHGPRHPGRRITSPCGAGRHAWQWPPLGDSERSLACEASGTLIQVKCLGPPPSATQSCGREAPPRLRAVEGDTPPSFVRRTWRNFARSFERKKVGGDPSSWKRTCVSYRRPCVLSGSDPSCVVNFHYVFSIWPFMFFKKGSASKL